MTTTPALQPASPALAWISTARLLRDVGSPRPTAIDLDRPGRGIAIEVSGSVTHSLLGVDLRSDFRLADSWVRGDDVTAVYETSDPRHLRTTAMWRLRRASGSHRAWELITSAQTSLLQSDAALAVVSEIDATTILWGSYTGKTVHWQEAVPQRPVCVLMNGGGAATPDDTTVLVAAHPGETPRMTVRKDGPRIIVECWLFSTALEKGVLLRSRTLAAIGPSANARDWAANLVAEFAASPPMLTT